MRKKNPGSKIMNQEDIEKYKICHEHLRFYGGLRFTQISIYFMIAGGILFSIYDPRFNSTYIRYILSILGVCATILFFILEESSTKYWVHYREVAQKIEGKSEFSLLSYRSKWYLRATNYLRTFFVVMTSIFIASSFIR